MKISTRRQALGKQAGGTLLGLVLGALLGLGAALAVAVYVTKVPIPFINKGAGRGVPSDAAEAQKNRDWDPNSALSGKPVVKPPPAVSGSLGTPTVAGAVPATVYPTPPAPAAGARPAGKVVSEDPLGDLARARSGAAPAAQVATAQPAANGGADPFNYFIQAGAFRTPEDAEQQRAKLSLLGFQAKVTEREQSGRTVYRVRLGPFDKKEDADRVKEKLDGNSLETALVRVQR